MPNQTMKIESLRLDLWAKIESHRLEMLVNDKVWKPGLLTIQLGFYGHLAILASSQNKESEYIIYIALTPWRQPCNCCGTTTSDQRIFDLLRWMSGTSFSLSLSLFSNCMCSCLDTCLPVFLFFFFLLGNLVIVGAQTPELAVSW